MLTHELTTAEPPDQPNPNQERTRLAEDIADLAARRDEREAALGDPADLSLQLHTATDQIAHLERQREAVRIARRELEQRHARLTGASRRISTQPWQRSCHDWTRGHYRQAMVADDLTVRVVAPESRSRGRR